MRTLLAVGIVVAIGSTAEAKYDACASTGAVALPTGRVARNAKLWLSNAQELGDEFRLRGAGVDRMVRLSRSGFVELGLLDADASYEVTIPRWDFRVATVETSGELDLTPPQQPSFPSLALAVSRDDPRAFDVAIDPGLSDDSVFVELELRDGDREEHELLWRDDLALLGRSRCIGWSELGGFELTAGTRACVTIRGVDVANNRSEPATRCAWVTESPRPVERITRPRLQFPTERPAPIAPRWPAIAYALFGMWIGGWACGRAARELVATAG